MRAVTVLNGFDSSKHSGIIANFNHNYIKEGIFDKRMSKIIKGAYMLREKSDYEDFYIASRQETSEVLSFGICVIILLLCVAVIKTVRKIVFHIMVIIWSRINKVSNLSVNQNHIYFNNGTEDIRWNFTDVKRINNFEYTFVLYNTYVNSFWKFRKHTLILDKGALSDAEVELLKDKSGQYNKYTEPIPIKKSYIDILVYLVVMLPVCITSAFSSKINVQTYTLEADAKYQDIVFLKIPLTITDTSNDEETIIKKMMDEYTSKFTGPEAFMMKFEEIEYEEITIYEKNPCIVAKVKFAMQPSIPVQNGTIDFTLGKLAEDKKCYGQCLIEISKKDNEYTLENIGTEEIDKLH